MNEVFLPPELVPGTRQSRLPGMRYLVVNVGKDLIDEGDDDNFNSGDAEQMDLGV